MGELGVRSDIAQWLIKLFFSGGGEYNVMAKVLDLDMGDSGSNFFSGVILVLTYHREVIEGENIYHHHHHLPAFQLKIPRWLQQLKHTVKNSLKELTITEITRALKIYISSVKSWGEEVCFQYFLKGVKQWCRMYFCWMGVPPLRGCPTEWHFLGCHHPELLRTVEQPRL
ncbi:Hypothetical predicted protein [Podarcis lilfordi]|uniref:Uncharacterized protein n=1 Tax=Podarcis lilfordi TaxID=74358 RepID=A0AA35PEL6_9SAUR|nr:Hypothetical predicted protein [Podarcis lilfordi]